MSKRSREIDAQLKADYKKALESSRPYRKIVILGVSDSGKTTLVKQLQIVYGEGLESQDNLLLFKQAARDNVYDSVTALLEGMNSLGIVTHDPETLVEYSRRIGTLKKCIILFLSSVESHGIIRCQVT